MFKKIYIEITNKCNLNCSFCSKNNRKIKEVSVEEFEYIVKKIDKYTDYLYLHVKGEPLLHKNLDGILNVARKYKKRVNITTNGSLLEKNMDVILKLFLHHLLQSLPHDKLRKVLLTLLYLVHK